MLAKVVIAAVTLVVALIVVRRLVEAAAAARVKVRARAETPPTRRVTTLRRDPATGVYRPED